MKAKALSNIVIAVLLAVLLHLVVGYLEESRERATAAINVVRCESYRKMLNAAAEGDMTKVAYYRWHYENAGKVVADFGVDAILEKTKNR